MSINGNALYLLLGCSTGINHLFFYLSMGGGGDQQTGRDKEKSEELSRAPSTALHHAADVSDHVILSCSISTTSTQMCGGENAGL